MKTNTFIVSIILCAAISITLSFFLVINRNEYRQLAVEQKAMNDALNEDNLNLHREIEYLKGSTHAFPFNVKDFEDQSIHIDDAGHPSMSFSTDPIAIRLHEIREVVLPTVFYHAYRNNTIGGLASSAGEKAVLHSVTVINPYYLQAILVSDDTVVVELYDVDYDYGLIRINRLGSDPL